MAALVVAVALRLWLSARQVRHVRAHRDAVPDAFAGEVPLEAHRKAADYTIARQRLGRVALAARTLVLLAWTLGGGLALLDGAIDGVAFVLAALFINELALLPLALYATFGLEQRFGFNRTTPRLFLIDLGKETLLALLLGAPLIWGALAFMARGWWLPLWAAWVGVSLFFAWAYPAFLAPLFWKFTPLEDEELDARLRALLDRTGFQSGGIYVMDGSRRSARANAYFTGFGSRKRIVLFDTLRSILDPSQIEAVLAHELGHFKLRHVWARLGLGTLFGLAAVGALAYLAGRPWFFAGLGVPAPSLHAAIVLFLWVAPLFTFPLRPLLSAWSRRHEYQADAFAAAHTDGAAMAAALVKLYEHNAATLTPDPLHSAWHDSHPPAPLRVGRLLD